MTKTNIEWSDEVWNCVRGCSRVSAGCEQCYAEQVARRFAGPGQPYEGLVRLDKSGRPKAQWNGIVRLVPDHLGDPLRWRRPRRVFVNSMSDLFHEALSFEEIAAVFGIMSSAPQHTFQVLTKRPERAREFFAWVANHATPDGREHGVCVAHAMELTPWRPAGVEDFEWPAPLGGDPWPLRNVWIGVSVENQASADERIPVLLSLPAAVRWVSYEPALGPVDWRKSGPESTDALRFGAPPLDGWVRGLDWIVVGGESGPGARPFDLAWARSTIEQCRAAGVPVFMKQLGAAPRWSVEPPPPRWTERKPDHKGGDPSEWPEDLRVREYPR